jgi:transmembrane sensor
MANRELAREIDEAAFDWAAKVTRGLTDAERAELDRWLEGDSRRLGAFVRAQAAWIHGERASALGSKPDAVEASRENHPVAPHPPRRLVNRRAFIGGGGALAASIAAATFFTFNRFRTIESSIGEVRRVTLLDGSKLTLDTDTRVQIAEGSGDRVLELVRGKLFLAVANALRPFAVVTQSLAMYMVEGAFAVEALPATPIVALVTEGRLSISQSRGLWAPRATLTLQENTGFRLPAGASLSSLVVHPISSERRDQLLAWRDGMLSFGGETLETAVREFDRYGSMRIVVTDPELARQNITGLFRADDPKGFADAVAPSFGASVARDGSVLRLFSKK